MRKLPYPANCAILAARVFFLVQSSHAASSGAPAGAPRRLFRCVVCRLLRRLAGASAAAIRAAKRKGPDHYRCGAHRGRDGHRDLRQRQGRAAPGRDRHFRRPDQAQPGVRPHRRRRRRAPSAGRRQVLRFAAALRFGRRNGRVRRPKLLDSRRQQAGARQGRAHRLPRQGPLPDQQRLVYDLRTRQGRLEHRGRVTGTRLQRRGRNGPQRQAALSGQHDRVSPVDEFPAGEGPQDRIPRARLHAVHAQRPGAEHAVLLEHFARTGRDHHAAVSQQARHAAAERVSLSRFQILRHREPGISSR